MSWYYVSLKLVLACLILLSSSQSFIICCLSLIYIIRKYMQLYVLYKNNLQTAKNMILQLNGGQYGPSFLRVPFSQIWSTLRRNVWRFLSTIIWCHYSCPYFSGTWITSHNPLSYLSVAFYPAMENISNFDQSSVSMNFLKNDEIILYVFNECRHYFFLLIFLQ